MEEYSQNQVELTGQLYTRIHNASMGIPRLFHKMLLETLRQTFLLDVEMGDLEAVDVAVEKMNLQNAKERVYDISDKKLTILKHILLSRHSKGRRPSELVERLDRDKSTISYHLQNLVEDRILQKEKQGRSAFYRVNDSVKPVLQRRIEKEGEFYA
jgi:predicted transcriptional regulator